MLSRRPLELSGAPVYKVRELADVKAEGAQGKVVALADIAQESAGSSQGRSRASAAGISRNADEEDEQSRV